MSRTEITYIEGTEIVKSIKTYKDDKLHSFDDQPALVEHYSDLIPGLVVCMGWYKDGELHRDNGKPAQICVNSMSDNAITELWFVDGELYQKDNKPVIVSYRDMLRKQVLDEKWYQPALGDHPYAIYYDINGLVSRKEFNCNSEDHPTAITYENGVMVRKEWTDEDGNYYRSTEKGQAIEYVNS